MCRARPIRRLRSFRAPFLVALSPPLLVARSEPRPGARSTGLARQAGQPPGGPFRLSADVRGSVQVSRARHAAMRTEVLVRADLARRFHCTLHRLARGTCLARPCSHLTTAWQLSHPRPILATNKWRLQPVALVAPLRTVCTIDLISCNQCDIIKQSGDYSGEPIQDDALQADESQT